MCFLCHYIASGSAVSQLHKHLCDTVEQTQVGDLLISVNGLQDYEDFYKKYLHDFVRFVHKSNLKDHKDLEYEVWNIKWGFKWI